MMGKVDFDPSNHSYEVKGKKVLSVTKVLPDIPDFLLCRQSFIEKTLLGSRVHDCCDVINNHIMAHDEIPDKSTYIGDGNDKRDLPYVQAYVNFLREQKPKIHFSEEALYHSQYDYAGTLDLVCDIGGKIYIVDIKTTAQVAPYAKLQLVAYLKAWNHSSELKVYHRAVLQLLPDERYRIIKYPVKEIGQDWSIFLCKLKSAQWDRENMKGYEY